MFAHPQAKVPSYRSRQAVCGPWQVATPPIDEYDKDTQRTAFVQRQRVHRMLATVWIQPRRAAIGAQQQIQRQAGTGAAQCQPRQQRDEHDTGVR